MQDLTDLLLAWYDKNGRQMPWRFKGKAPDSYPVWVSEIMLQQTTVATVYDYFLRWMKRFPTMEALANANIDDVLLAWQGLGYYTRAKKMHECAKVVMNKYNGQFPCDRQELLKLPGIGPYTASSICAFAFNLPETVVDGNVIRVIARLYGITKQVDKDMIYPLAQKLTSKTRGADYASAIMDLGATVCKPQNPICDVCPWKEVCVAHNKNIQNEIPIIKKPQKRKSEGAIFLCFDEKKKIFITKRNKGLLSGLWEFPWNIDGQNPPFNANWRQLNKSVHHVFTHIDFTADIFVAYNVKEQGTFVEISTLKDYAFSTLMKKVLKVIESI
ncbi:MAG: A/G-specific adenine glycosylase [Alphaproteobacteria bacterium]